MTYSVRMFPVAEIPVPIWECLFGRNDCSFYRLIFYVWLIQGNGRNVLVDARPPPLLQDFEALRAACQGIDPRSTMKRLQTLEEVFAEADITPESIDSLLITQPITYQAAAWLTACFREQRYICRAQACSNFCSTIRITLLPTHISLSRAGPFSGNYALRIDWCLRICPFR